MVPKNDVGKSVEELEIGGLDPSEMGEAVAVLARAMRDAPLPVAVFGDDAERRRRGLHRLFGRAAEVLGWRPFMLVARRAGGTIVGVCGVMPPGACPPSPDQRQRIALDLVGSGPLAVDRAARWLADWSARDPTRRHWHLGPVAVAPPLQGAGIGSGLLRVVCARMDAAGDDAYLETDTPSNVPFFQRFGFEVIGDQEVLGVPTWFMRRRPAATNGHGPPARSRRSGCPPAGAGCGR